MFGFTFKRFIGGVVAALLVSLGAGSVQALGKSETAAAEGGSVTIGRHASGCLLALRQTSLYTLPEQEQHVGSILRASLLPNSGFDLLEPIAVVKPLSPKQPDVRLAIFPNKPYVLDLARSKIVLANLKGVPIKSLNAMTVSDPIQILVE